MSTGFKITQETWEHMPPEQRDWIVFETMLALREDVEALKTKRWINSSLAFIGGVVGGIIFCLAKSLGFK